MGFLKQWDDNKKEWEPNLKELQKLAKEKLSCSLVSITRAIKNKDIATCILGAKPPEKIKENLKYLKIVPKLTRNNRSNNLEYNIVHESVYFKKKKENLRLY